MTETGLIKRIQRLHTDALNTPDPHDHKAKGVDRRASARDRVAWREECEHGPRIARLYSDEAGRKRVNRLLSHLASEGKVVLWGFGSRITHVCVARD